MRGPFDLNGDGHINLGEAGLAAGFVNHLMEDADSGGDGDYIPSSGRGGSNCCLITLLIIFGIVGLIFFFIFLVNNTINDIERLNARNSEEPIEETIRKAEEVFAAEEKAREEAAEKERERERVEKGESAQVMPADLGEKLPYVGLSSVWIADTWLGEPDEIDTVPISGGTKEGAITYKWKAKNGTDDVVFSAYVRDDAVIAVNRGYSATDYWPDLWDMPDLYASGTPRETETYTPEPTPPDPADYDDPEDYADDTSDWFEKHGYDDPWGAAEEYWEDNY